MRYISTRGYREGLNAAQVIIKGIAPDGGLFVPESIPVLGWEGLPGLSYGELAGRIFGLYLDGFSPDQIQQCIAGAYNAGSFDHPDIAPLVRLKEGLWVQELWHGPTCAFKDMALQMLPRLLVTSAGLEQEGGEIVILVATSGDTGKAALEGFRDVPGTRVVVFYPAEGVSEVQKRQMITQKGNNVDVAGVEGNFDDAQNGVKAIFADNGLKDRLAARKIKLSSANSINWGRLLPQIVYYVWAYLKMAGQGGIKAGDPVNFVVPTGNFGNILAAYYARRMGLPVGRLICASNVNKVLTDFINSAVYDRRRCFKRTISPSMDILISSNLERLLFELSGHDSGRVMKWMDELGSQGYYEIDPQTRDKIAGLFWGGCADDEQTAGTIRDTWEEFGYLIDPHTAVGMNVYGQYVHETGDTTPTVLASTASPFKFSGDVARAILPASELEGLDEFAIMKKLALVSSLTIPWSLAELEELPVRHQTVTGREQMPETVLQFLNVH